MTHDRLVGGRRLSADRTFGLHVCFTGFRKEAVEAFYSGGLKALQTTAAPRIRADHASPSMSEANGRAGGEFPRDSGGYDPAIKMARTQILMQGASENRDFQNATRDARRTKTSDQIVARSLQ